ncbi:MAG TPA: aminopeptidase [Candidatus Atribacteria bacterium]|nr:aminopeptidase [Candidatus Atribacteria bacterium]
MIEMMNMSKEMIGAGILIDICGVVKPGEKVVIATDQEKVDIANIIAKACIIRHIEPIILNMIPRKSHGEEPPIPYTAALEKADVVFAATSFSLFHTNARIEACKKGARWVNLPGYSRKMLCEGGLFVDFQKQREKAEKIGKILSSTSFVKIETDKGTDIQFSIAEREATVESGISDKPGMVNSPPDIEVCIAPIEGTAEGKIVIDGSIILPGLGPLNEDVILHVSKGFVTRIEGSREAMLFKEALEQAQEKEVFNVGEFGIGLNPKCRICGSMLEDEGVYGTIHFGIGDNHTMGGSIESSMHTDVVIKNPTVTLDNKVIMNSGGYVND